MQESEYGSITAQCHICKRNIPVPSTWAANYVMLNQLPCRSCQE